MSCVVLSVVVRCVLFVVSCVLCVVRCLVFEVCWLLFVVLLAVVRGEMCVGCDLVLGPFY